ncbi:MAG: hypothetical protein JSV51_08080 [Candidatus Bathyarchaeota archaeon]|nr:MAG: hypothetical protein JSV51_08080 [Candidatus Bathyarchaeota archaeon]
MKANSLVIAAISIIASLAFLVFFTASWEMLGWVGLWVYVGVMMAVFGAWILLSIKLGVEKNPLKTIDFAIIAMFVALMAVIDYGSMFVPGLTFLWYSFPQFAGPILFYFPLGIAVAAALKLSPKPGSAFTLLLVYGIIGQVFFFNPIWFARAIMAALALEAFYLSSKRGTLSSLLLAGFMFGVLYNAAATIFQIYSWGFWQPLFVTLPEVILAGVMMAIGCFLGYAIGDRAKTVMY